MAICLLERGRLALQDRMRSVSVSLTISSLQQRAFHLSTRI